MVWYAVLCFGALCSAVVRCARPPYHVIAPMQQNRTWRPIRTVHYIASVQQNQARNLISLHPCNGLAPASKSASSASPACPSRPAIAASPHSHDHPFHMRIMSCLLVCLLHECIHLYVYKWCGTRQDIPNFVPVHIKLSILLGMR